MAWARPPHLGTLSGTSLHGARAFLCVNEILMVLGAEAQLGRGSGALLPASYVICAAQKGH